MRQATDLRSVDWLRDYLSAQAGIALSKGIDPEAGLWRQGLTPFCDAIYSAPPSIFLADGSAPEGTTVWVRDGLLPLMTFFQVYSPEMVSAKLMVHARFRSVVPDKWLSKVLFYRVKHLSSEIYSDLSKLIIIGCQSPAMGSLLDTEDVLRLIVNKWQLGSGKKLKVQCWLPVKSPHFLGFPQQTENGVERLYRALRLLGDGVEFVEWPDLALEQDLSNAHLVEINSGNLVQESYCTHLLMSRGARMVSVASVVGKLSLSSGENQTRQPGSEFFHLSPYHGLEIENDLQKPKAEGIFLSGAKLEFLSGLEEVLNWDNSMMKRIKRNISTIGQPKRQNSTPIRQS